MSFSKKTAELEKLLNTFQEKSYDLLDEMLGKFSAKFVKKSWKNWYAPISSRSPEENSGVNIQGIVIRFSEKLPGRKFTALFSWLNYKL